MIDATHKTSTQIDTICVDNDNGHHNNSTITAATTTVTPITSTWYPLVGDRVYGNYINNGLWYIGLIRSVHDDLTFDIDYDDGDKEYRIDHGLIRMIKGTRVRSDSYLHRGMSNHQSKSNNNNDNDNLKNRGRCNSSTDRYNSGKWLLGIISKVYKDSSTYDIEYDDGDFDVNIDITHIQLLVHSKVIVNNKSCRILNVKKNRYNQYNIGVIIDDVDDDDDDDRKTRGHSYNDNHHHHHDFYNDDVERRYDVVYEDGSGSYDIPLSSIRLVGGIIDAVHDCYNTSLANHILTSSSQSSSSSTTTSSQSSQSSSSSTTTSTTSTIATTLKQTNKFLYNQPFITFNNALTHDDVQQIILLSQCIQHIAPHYHQNRKFGNGDNYNGGNSCVFLGGFMHDILPCLVNKIRAIATHALYHRYDKVDNGDDDNDKVDNDDDNDDNDDDNDDHDDDNDDHDDHDDDDDHYNIDNRFNIPISTLGIRGIEYLKYTEGMALNWHKDHDSIYTMVIMLSSSTAYSGGDFMIKDIYTNPDVTSIHEIKLPFLGRYSS